MICSKCKGVSSATRVSDFSFLMGDPSWMYILSSCLRLGLKRLRNLKRDFRRGFLLFREGREWGKKYAVG